MARKDIHRPSAIEPADYEFVAFDYLPNDGDIIGNAMFLAEQRRYKVEHMKRSGGRYSSHEHGGLCHICGSVNAIYSASFYHAKSNSYIKAGLDCADKLECSGVEAFRKNVKNALEASAGKRKAKAVLEKLGMPKAWEVYEADVAKRAAYRNACEDWNDAGEEGPAPKFVAPSKDEEIVIDMVGRLVQWGSISDKAERYLAVLLDRIARAPQIAAERALEMANAKPVPISEGRVVIKGEVLKVKQQEGLYGIEVKMLVKASDGFKVWGSVPSAIRSEVERGAVVEFNAALRPSDDDKYFGFFSRPSKAKVYKALAA